MESLFKRSKSRRGQVVLMLAGSLLAHGGLVGIGALLERPEPTPVEVTWWNGPPEEESPPSKPAEIPIEQAKMPEDVPTATPEIAEVVDATPPPVDVDPELSEPSTPTPRQKLAAKPVTSTRTTAPRSTNLVASTPGSGRSGTGSAASPNAAMPWVMPHPSYPAGARNFASGAGLTVMRITTDAAGRVSSVVVVRSAGNPLLDAHTVSYVRENWRGPANASRTTEFLYQLR